MEPTKTFDLGLEVDAYINRLDNNLLLSNEDIDELRDHLHCHVEELTDVGLREVEAFEVSKMRLGTPELIHGEFKKVKSNYQASRYLLVAIFLLFFTRLIVSSFDLMSDMSVLLIGKLGIDKALVLYFDFGFKTLLVSLISWSIWAQLKKENINKLLLFCIPFLSLFADALFQMVSGLIFDSNSNIYVANYGSFVRNSSFIMLIYYMFLISLFYYLWQKNAPSFRRFSKT